MALLTCRLFGVPSTVAGTARELTGKQPSRLRRETELAGKALAAATAEGALEGNATFCLESTMRERVTSAAADSAERRVGLRRG